MITKKDDEYNIYRSNDFTKEKSILDNYYHDSLAETKLEYISRIFDDTPTAVITNSGNVIHFSFKYNEDPRINILNIYDGESMNCPIKHYGTIYVNEKFNKILIQHFNHHVRVNYRIDNGTIPHLVDIFPINEVLDVYDEYANFEYTIKNYICHNDQYIVQYDKTTLNIRDIKNNTLISSINTIGYDNIINIFIRDDFILAVFITFINVYSISKSKFMGRVSPSDGFIFNNTKKLVIHKNRWLIFYTVKITKKNGNKHDPRIRSHNNEIVERNISKVDLLSLDHESHRLAFIMAEISDRKCAANRFTNNVLFDRNLLGEIFNFMPRYDKLDVPLDLKNKSIYYKNSHFSDDYVLVERS